MPLLILIIFCLLRVIWGGSKFIVGAVGNIRGGLDFNAFGIVVRLAAKMV